MNIIMKSFFVKRQSIPHNKEKHLRLTIIIAGIISLAAYTALLFFSHHRPVLHSNEMLEAARLMDKTIAVIGDYCAQSGIEIDKTIDPNQTGLIGPEYTELTTTVGNLEAKRTTTNPNIAGLLVHLLYQAGVKPGDAIAVGCSASFPALMVASLAAAKAMDVKPVIIISLGASSYGGTKPAFNLLDIYKLLLEEGIFSAKPAAVSLGGGNDIGLNYEPELHEQLLEQIQSSGIPFIYEADLRKNVAARMRIYLNASYPKSISAFINTGGSYANLGTSQLALKLKPGLNQRISIPAEEQRGVLFQMAAQDVPIIHLLYIKGLIMKYGLPWDPVPLPKPGEQNYYVNRRQDTVHFWVISILYFAALIMLIFYQIVLKSSKIKILDKFD
jgi:poly-gamma-glutamate system protein